MIHCLHEEVMNKLLFILIWNLFEQGFLRYLVSPKFVIWLRKGLLVFFGLHFCLTTFSCVPLPVEKVPSPHQFPAQEG